MKKFLLSAFFIGAVYTAQAQTNLAGTAATTRAVLSMSATDMTRQMYNNLELNEGQYIKLKALNQARLDRYSEIERMYSNDTQMRDAKIKEVNDQLDEQFAEVLTPKQFTAYLEMEGRATSGGASSPEGTSTMNSTSTNVSAGSAAAESAEGEVKVKDDKVKVESSYGEMKKKRKSKN
ncbi:hypothetical protein [Rufibacter quisquiliarum]|uniref:DUF4890 domain-containing protein n=1 Tax=Rufibacter quisquiliarum TaxID=1549639 RepID=A0A839GIN4_9BACT|nr:hypothetical protein [Rufibacter quisquiliarum]MBA9078722.1 hypothetical protein [Rufibacter quisquiliarum]